MKTELTKTELNALSWAITLLWVIPWSIFSAFVLTKVWLWFVVPLGLPPIGVAHAYGLGLLVAWLTTALDTKPETLDTLLFRFVAAPARPTLVLIISLLAKGAM